MIVTLIESAFSGINARLDDLEKKVGKNTDAIADLKELNGLFDKRVDEMAEGIVKDLKAIADTKNTEDFYSEYKNGGIE